jgi:hypothetical protein
MRIPAGPTGSSDRRSPNEAFLGGPRKVMLDAGSYASCFRRPEEEESAVAVRVSWSAPPRKNPNATTQSPAATATTNQST